MVSGTFNSIQFIFICIALFTKVIVSKQLYTNKSKVKCVCVPSLMSKQGDGGKEKLPEMVIGRNLERNQAQQRTHPHMGLHCSVRVCEHNVCWCSPWKTAEAFSWQYEALPVDRSRVKGGRSGSPAAQECSSAEGEGKWLGTLTVTVWR